MTAEDRIFLRRHFQAFSDLAPGQPLAARRATVRAGRAIGISLGDLALWFRLSRSVIEEDAYHNHIRRAYIQRWKYARIRAERARRALRQAEGRERAAAERARARGLELPEEGIAA